MPRSNLQLPNLESEIINRHGKGTVPGAAFSIQHLTSTPRSLTSTFQSNGVVDISSKHEAIVLHKADVVLGRLAAQVGDKHLAACWHILIAQHTTEQHRTGGLWRPHEAVGR